MALSALLAHESMGSVVGLAVVARIPSWDTPLYPGGMLPRRCTSFYHWVRVAERHSVFATLALRKHCAVQQSNACAKAILVEWLRIDTFCVGGFSFGVNTGWATIAESPQGFFSADRFPHFTLGYCATIGAMTAAARLGTECGQTPGLESKRFGTTRGGGESHFDCGVARGGGGGMV